MRLVSLQGLLARDQLSSDSASTLAASHPDPELQKFSLQGLLTHNTAGGREGTVLADQTCIRHTVCCLGHECPRAASHQSCRCERKRERAFLMQGLLTPVPLEEAVSRLRAKWDGFFSSESTRKAARNPRLSRITERRSSLGPIPEAQVGGPASGCAQLF